MKASGKMVKLTDSSRKNSDFSDLGVSENGTYPKTMLKEVEEGVYRPAHFGVNRWAVNLIGHDVLFVSNSNQ
jgi:hypothetical protein